MTRIYVVVEGPTEESFVNDVLAPELWPSGKYLIPIIVGPPGHKGGNTNYARVKKDVITQLKQDHAAYCSTMLDFYGLGQGFPGTPLPPNLSNTQKVSHIERATLEDIAASVDDGLQPRSRFLPYLQLHEFEALLFSDPNALAAGIGQPDIAHDFVTIRDAFPTPEDINDNPNSAPSKRVLQCHPPYRKVLDGTLAAERVGIDRMRDECPHFREWVERLAALGAE
ncbi:MAG: DUF4276 family protein [Terriglobia bacterium]